MSSDLSLILDELVQDQQASLQHGARLGPRATLESLEGWEPPAALRTDQDAQLSNPKTYLSPPAGAGGSSSLGLPSLPTGFGQPGSPLTSLLLAVDGYGAAQSAQLPQLTYSHDFNQTSCEIGAVVSPLEKPAEVSSQEAVHGEDTQDPATPPEPVTETREVRMKEKEKEKNRRNQAKYRDRQKAKVSEMERQLAALRDEVGSLKSRNSLLKRQVLQQGTAPSYGAGLALGNGNHGGIVLAGDPNRMLVMWVRLSWTLDQPVVISVQEQQVPMSLQDVGEMELTDFMSLWRKYVNEFAKLLNQDFDDYSADSFISRRCKRLRDEVAAIFCYKACSRRNGTPDLKQLCMDTQRHRPDERPTADLWRSVVAKCNLTELQRLQIMRARRTYLDSLRIERNTIVAALQTNLLTIGTGDLSVTGQTIPECLRNNLQVESDIGARYQCSIAYEILSPVQCAVTMVEAYPWVPNLVAIGDAVAQQMGYPGPPQLLAPPASASVTAA